MGFFQASVLEWGAIALAQVKKNLYMYLYNPLARFSFTAQSSVCSERILLTCLKHSIKKDNKDTVLSPDHSSKETKQ